MFQRNSAKLLYSGLYIVNHYNVAASWHNGSQ